MDGDPDHGLLTEGPIHQLALCLEHECVFPTAAGTQHLPMPALAHIPPFEGMSIWPLYILDEKKKCPTCPVLLKALFAVKSCEKEEGFLPGQTLQPSLSSQQDQQGQQAQKKNYIRC